MKLPIPCQTIINDISISLWLRNSNQEFKFRLVEGCADISMADSNVSCGFRVRRRKSNLSCGKKGRRVGPRWKSAKEVPQGATSRLAERHMAAQAKVIKRQKTTATNRKGKATIKSLTSQLAQEQKKDKEGSCLNFPKASKDCVDYLPGAQAAKRHDLSNLVAKGMERLRMPKLTDAQMSIAEKYWKETFTSLTPRQGRG
jgi:hypothetical protein